MESEVSLEPPEVDLFCVVFLDQPRLNAEIGEEREVMPAGKLSKVLTGNHDGVRGIPGTTGGGFVLRRVPRPAQVERRGLVDVCADRQLVELCISLAFERTASDLS